MIFLWMKNSQMKKTWYVSASGIASLGWNILDEKSWCVAFCDYIFGWKCLGVVTFWDFIFGWKYLDVVTLSDEISWMNDLMLKYLGWNVLILTFREMSWMNVWILTWQFLDEIGASLLLKPVCFRSIGKRAWMSGDCIGTVAVAEKGERWQAHVQRIQAPPLLLASSLLFVEAEAKWGNEEIQQKRQERLGMWCRTTVVSWKDEHEFLCIFFLLLLLGTGAQAIQSISLKQRNDSSLVQQGSRSFQKTQSQLFCSEQFVRWKQGILEDREREESDQE